MKFNQFAIIGLGRFGANLAHEFIRQGYEVLGIDINEEMIEDLRNVITHGVAADATDKQTLQAIGIHNFDCAIVAIGDDVQANIMASILLKELGVKWIVAKAVTLQHGRVLEKIGVDRVIYPERDMAIRVVNQLVSPNLLDYIELSDDYTIAEISVPEKISGKSIRTLNTRALYGCSIVAINKEDEVIIAPLADDVLLTGDIMVVIGTKQQVEMFEQEAMS